ncbi:polygalacturonase inhibitor 1-like isoform X2 [Cryptomeria japonica]|uniref:polygalacturonase inhibitor 1-like isoform X2 n=1 Tax=Cryptomeria japonica TaxID=3369 RepID=UPI0027DAB3B9|nr:polygalacturonase inhibitor 1-like isoform X2 [Cryptomeria japonica]
MALSLQKLCSVFISVFVVFSFSPRPSLSNGCLSHESEALLLIKADSNDSADLSSWVNGTDCCTMWDGISCNNHTKQVVSLDLGFDNDYFDGVISESLCQLRFLTSLTIAGVSVSKNHLATVWEDLLPTVCSCMWLC